VAPDFLAKVLAGRADTPAGPVAALDPATHRAWIASLSAAIAEKQGGGREPVILCPEETRFLIKSSTEREIPALVVLSIPEIPNDIKIEPLGEIHVT
jgi:flagellar biosynthesis protein FlhA